MKPRAFHCSAGREAFVEDARYDGEQRSPQARPSGRSGRKREAVTVECE